MLRMIVFAVSMTFVSATIAEETTRTWEGTWNNRKYNTKGPLKCVAEQVSAGKWKGVFTGTFQGDPFKYEAEFEAKEGRRGAQELSGKATIRGHKYQWTGMMRGKALNGKYTSSVGYHGEFVLKEK